jgi:hypothetical protein
VDIRLILIFILIGAIFVFAYSHVKKVIIRIILFTIYMMNNIVILLPPIIDSITSFGIYRIILLFTNHLTELLIVAFLVFLLVAIKKVFNRI